MLVRVPTLAQALVLLLELVRALVLVVASVVASAELEPVALAASMAAPVTLAPVTALMRIPRVLPSTPGCFLFFCQRNAAAINSYAWNNAARVSGPRCSTSGRSGRRSVSRRASPNAASMAPFMLHLGSIETVSGSFLLLLMMLRAACCRCCCYCDCYCWRCCCSSCCCCYRYNCARTATAPAAAPTATSAASAALLPQLYRSALGVLARDTK